MKTQLTPDVIKETRQAFKRAALATMSPEELADAVYVCSGLALLSGLKPALETCCEHPEYGEAIKKMIRASNQCAVDCESCLN